MNLIKLLSVFICLLISLNTFADDLGLVIPEWSDFAPSAFVDVQEPKGLMAKVNITAAYWYQRKVDFENKLAECQALENTQKIASCYEDLKTKQYQENSDYNARIEAKLNADTGIQGMTDSTSNMLQLNNYIDTFSRSMPNELR